MLKIKIKILSIHLNDTAKSKDDVICYVGIGVVLCR